MLTPLTRKATLGIAISTFLVGTSIHAQGSAGTDNSPGKMRSESTQMERDGSTTNNRMTSRSDPRAAEGAIDVNRIAKGMRADKVIGSTVYNQANEAIGSVDDLIIEPNDRVVYAIVSVGGFLGVGDRLVAVPFDQINFRRDNNDTRVVMAESSKAQLEAMPEFRYVR